MAGLKILTTETQLVVTLVELKAFLKVDNANDDTVLELIRTATHNWAKEYTARSITTITYQLFIDAIYDIDLPLREGSYLGIDQSINRRSILLPKSPVISVTHIKSYDDSDSATTFSSSKYYVDNVNTPARIVLRQGETYPSALRVANSLEIQYVAGYGTTTDVPYDIKIACLSYASYLYEHRGDLLNGNRVLAPTSATQLLQSYRIKSLSTHPYRGHAHYGGMFG